MHLIEQGLQPTNWCQFKTPPGNIFLVDAQALTTIPCMLHPCVAVCRRRPSARLQMPQLWSDPASAARAAARQLHHLASSSLSSSSLSSSSSWML
jgi:hypothetical protein